MFFNFIKIELLEFVLQLQSMTVLGELGENQDSKKQKKMKIGVYIGLIHPFLLIV